MQRFVTKLLCEHLLRGAGAAAAVVTTIFANTTVCFTARFSVTTPNTGGPFSPHASDKAVEAQLLQPMHVETSDLQPQDVHDAATVVVLRKPAAEYNNRFLVALSLPQSALMLSVFLCQEITAFASRAYSSQVL